MAAVQPAVAFAALEDVRYVQIAADCGVNVETVRRSMRGRTRPNPAVVDWCVKRFGLPPEVLFRERATVGK